MNLVVISKTKHSAVIGIRTKDNSIILKRNYKIVNGKIRKCGIMYKVNELEVVT